MSPKGKLVLMGGGDLEELRPGLTAMVETTKNKGPIYFIPHAHPPENFGKYTEIVQEWFAACGLPPNQLQLWDDLTANTENILAQCGGVFLGGGNTFHLMQAIRAAKLDKALPKFYMEGGCIGGNSARAILWGDDIEYAHDPNDIDLKDFVGFKKLKNLNPWPHFTDERYHDEISAYVQKKKNAVLALGDHVNCIIENQTIEIRGKGPAKIYSVKGEFPLQEGAPMKMENLIY